VEAQGGPPGLSAGGDLGQAVPSRSRSRTAAGCLRSPAVIGVLVGAPRSTGARAVSAHERRLARLRRARFADPQAPGWCHQSKNVRETSRSRATRGMRTGVGERCVHGTQRMFERLQATTKSRCAFGVTRDQQIANVRSAPGRRPLSRPTPPRILPMGPGRNSRRLLARRSFLTTPELAALGCTRRRDGMSG
jgi:hypothetical protein